MQGVSSMQRAYLAVLLRLVLAGSGVVVSSMLVAMALCMLRCGGRCCVRAR